MFAKLKKKIETEGGLVPTVTDPAGKSSSLRDSLTSLPRAGSIQHLGISPPGSVTDDNVSVQDESFSRDDIVHLLQKKSEQCKKLEGNISDLAALVKEKSKTVERLETALKQQEESSDKKLLEQKEEFDKLIECHKDEKLKLEKLMKTEGFLKTCQSELRTKTIQCQATEIQVKKLTNEVDSLKLRAAALESEIGKLREENRERAELVISLSKDRATFEKRQEEMNKSMEEKEIQALHLQTQLSKLQEEYSNLIGASDLQRSKTSKLLQEKDDHINTLQERVRTLEHRISDFSLSGDEQLNALQVERDLIDQKLSETQQQLAEVRSSLNDKISHLENQVSHLNAEIVEDSEKLAASHKMNDQMRDSFHKQLEDFRSRLEEAEKRALVNEEQSTSKETHYRKQIEELETELSKQKLQALDSDTNLRAKVVSLDMQIMELENCRKIEKEEAKFRISHLEKQADVFADKEIKLEGQVKDLEITVNRLQGVIMEKDSKIDSLKQQIQDGKVSGNDQTSKILDLQQQVLQVKSELDHIKETRDHLEKRLQTSEEENGRLLASTIDLNNQIQTLRSLNSDSKLELERMVNLKSEAEAALRQKLESLEQMIKKNEISETESGLHSEKVDEMSKTILSLQTQLAEKSRTVKKQEQTLKDLRVTLQRELKVQLLPNDEGQESTNSNNSLSPSTSRKLGSNSQQSPKPQESQKHLHYPHQQNYKQSNLIHGSSHTTASAAVLAVQSSPSSMVMLAASSSSVPSGALDALTVHTDHVRRELDKDINFLYLKHVILKFMLSRESEAMHLIKAVSMLLNFTLQEQQLIRDTLEYKMSWFGHRPSVGEGQTSKVIPPAL